ncbi:hypothetical protein MTR_5g044765 [Medicago truncatula]|uniref:Uncharacterized protein n=1 Tax=Medicago truncatula TaxID=3880 RepID=A0A072UDM9_MEDTR|nr:hypothetical protein MTR_5g044765 [Medicago truncatula]
MSSDCNVDDTKVSELEKSRDARGLPQPARSDQPNPQILVWVRAVKTGGPIRLGPALTGFRLYRVGSKIPVEKRA